MKTTEIEKQSTKVNSQALLLKHQRIHHKGDSGEAKVEEEEDETKAEAPVCCPVCQVVINNDYALAIHQGSVQGVGATVGVQVVWKELCSPPRA